MEYPNSLEEADVHETEPSLACTEIQPLSGTPPAVDSAREVVGAVTVLVTTGPDGGR